MPLLVLDGALHHHGQGRCRVETRDRRRQSGEPVGRLALDPGAEGPRFRRDAALSLRHRPSTPPPASALASEPCGAPVPPSIADRPSCFFSVACWACAVEQLAFVPMAAPPSTSIRKSLRKSIVPPFGGSGQDTPRTERRVSLVCDGGAQARLQRIGDSDAACRTRVALGKQFRLRHLDYDVVQGGGLEELMQHPLRSLSGDEEDAGRPARLGERTHVAQNQREGAKALL